MIEQGKKEMVYKKEVSPSKLYEEIYIQEPKLTPGFDENGEICVHVRIFTNGDTLTIWVPEELDEAIIDDIVENHVIPIEIKEGDE